MIDDEERKTEITKAQETDCCPKCNTNLIFHSDHERDSSNDYTYCPKCRWRFGEMETWRLNI